MGVIWLSNPDDQHNFIMSSDNVAVDALCLRVDMTTSRVILLVGRIWVILAFAWDNILIIRRTALRSRQRIKLSYASRIAQGDSPAPGPSGGLVCPFQDGIKTTTSILDDESMTILGTTNTSGLIHDGEAARWKVLSHLRYISARAEDATLLGKKFPDSSITNGEFSNDPNARAC